MVFIAWCIGDKSESSHKTTKIVRLPEFTELLRHERMQDLVRKQTMVDDHNIMEICTVFVVVLPQLVVDPGS